MKKRSVLFGAHRPIEGAVPLRSTALLDATSAAFVCQDRCIELASTPGVIHLSDKLSAALLTILEWTTVYDLEVHDLALDSVNVSPDRLTTAYAGLITPTQLPIGALLGASQGVERIRDFVNEQRHRPRDYPLRVHDDEKFDHTPYATTQSWPTPRDELIVSAGGDMEKCYFDGCFENGVRLKIANSNDGAERALFYAELSDILGKPILLSDGKQRWLKTIQRRVIGDIHSVITSSVDGKAKQALQARFPDTDARSLNTEFDYPPLAEMIMRRARERRVSLVEAAREIREAPGAVAYRTLIAQLYSYAKLGRSWESNLSSILGEISMACKKWFEKEDKDAKALKIQVAKIPKLGWLFELIGLPQISVKLPFHEREEAYLSFIFDWYRLKVAI
jgi:hypothetical protein